MPKKDWPSESKQMTHPTMEMKDLKQISALSYYSQKLLFEF